VYSLKLYTLKIIARYMTRHNISSQNTTLSKPVPENSFKNRDKNAPDAKNNERHVEIPDFPNLYTYSVFNCDLQKNKKRPGKLQYATFAVLKFQFDHPTRCRVLSNKIICIFA